MTTPDQRAALAQELEQLIENVRSGREIMIDSYESDLLNFVLTHRTELAAALRSTAAAQTSAERDVLAERERQRSVEGWTDAHDDAYRGPHLAVAAGCYALFSDSYPNAGEPPPIWPWAPEWWKPSNYRRDLVKAGALILAEIERLDRAAIAASAEGCAAGGAG